MSDSKELTTTESQELEVLEAVVTSGMKSFVEVGTALLEIRDRRLYRATGEKFEVYCQAKWGFTRRRADQLIDAAKIVAEFAPENENPGSKNLSGDVETAIGPTTEKLTRALKDAPPGKRKEAWDKAVASAPTDKAGKPKPTAAHVRRVVKDAAKDADPPAAPIPPAVSVDAEGVPLPDRADLRSAFEQCPRFDALLNQLTQAQRELNALYETAAGAHFEQQTVNRSVKDVRSAVKFAKPYGVCPECKGKGCPKTWGCRGLGWLTTEQYGRVPPEKKAAMLAKGAA